MDAEPQPQPQPTYVSDCPCDGCRMKREWKEWLKSQPPYLSEDDPRRKWIRLGDLEASFSGWTYATIRSVSPDHRKGSIYLDRTAVERILELFPDTGEDD